MANPRGTASEVIEAEGEVSETVQKAFNTGDVARARNLLDEWEAAQPFTLNTFSRLRYWRRLLGQPDRAVAATRRMVELRPADAWERVADLVRLGELHLELHQRDAAWAALAEAASWHRLTEWYTAGLVRSVVELALDLSASLPPESVLSRRAYELAAGLLDDGASFSAVILEKARDRADAFGDEPRLARYAEAARQSRRRAHGQSRRRPPGGGGV